jgi:transposase
MRYSFEFKLKCIEPYRSGRWPKTPDGISAHHFHNTIRTWSEIDERYGSEALKHPKHQRKWSSEDKLVLVSQVFSGDSLCSVACSAGINSGMLCQWVRRYKEKGYNGLVNKPKGRKPKEPSMKKKKSDKPQPLTESEREELIRLREENAYMKAEIAFRKKLISP